MQQQSVGLVSGGQSHSGVQGQRTNRTVRRTTTATIVNPRHAIVCGVILIVTAALGATFNIVVVIIAEGMRTDGYVEESLAMIFYGIWVGLAFAAAGTFGILAGKKKTKNMIITFMALSIASACLSIIQFSLAIVGATQVSDFAGPNCVNCYNQMEIEKVSAVIAMLSLLAVAAVIGGASAIWGWVICCRSICCNSVQTTRQTHTSSTTTHRYQNPPSSRNR